MFSLTDNQVFILIFILFLSLILNLCFLAAFRIKVVRKIDKILKNNSIRKESFDIFFGRHSLYVWATFFPKNFAKSGRKQRLFDPEIIRSELSLIDRIIMLSHWFFFAIFFSITIFLIVFTDYY
ncbi:hypothetical protein MSP8886_00325 [Marinomonas spartinae]|uniref:Uncharacterized protein n=1 Tax=Marinomonas spartinae TaxID=1792290 RepID=A0A1A8T427_9GAMM|nr:hypothetical protein [Marinomonas spartinae]SBS25601.1 hypothetical protein MSP8886_00325 [Marinomonas spartinae]